MKVGYVDTSVLVAVALGEPAARSVSGRLRSFDRLVSSNLLEAEFRSTLRREGIEGDGAGLLGGLSWILPNRPLTAELERVLQLGMLRGADLWHLACALFLSPEPRRLSFITLDPPQKDLARNLGFTV